MEFREALRNFTARRGFNPASVVGHKSGGAIEKDTKPTFYSNWQNKGRREFSLGSDRSFKHADGRSAYSRDQLFAGLRDRNFDMARAAHFNALLNV